MLLHREKDVCSQIFSDIFVPFNGLKSGKKPARHRDNLELGTLWRAPFFKKNLLFCHTLSRFLIPIV